MRLTSRILLRSHQIRQRCTTLLLPLKLQRRFTSTRQRPPPRWPGWTAGDDQEHLNCLGWVTGRTRRSRGKSRGNAHVTDETAIRPQRRHGQGRNGDSPAAWRHRFDNAWCISDADPPGAVGVPTIASSQPARRPVGRRLSQFVASGVGGTVILL
jgi:hypothetical protein